MKNTNIWCKNIHLILCGPLFPTILEERINHIPMSTKIYSIKACNTSPLLHWNLSLWLSPCSILFLSSNMFFFVFNRWHDTLYIIRKFKYQSFEWCIICLISCNKSLVTNNCFMWFSFQKLNRKYSIENEGKK